MSDEFFVGYDKLPDNDRRFLLRAVPLGLVALAGTGALIGSRAVSSGGGKWETGTPVTVTGRIGFHPYPTIWVNGQGMVIAGIGKAGADQYIRPYEGQSVTVKGIRIVREDCVMLGVGEGDIASTNAETAPIPVVTSDASIEVIGEVLDAQCFMGIMNPGYGRTHRGCAALCIRGGQPVFFSMGIRGSSGDPGNSGCAGQGFILADRNGNKINDQVLGDVAVPMILEAQLERIGNFTRLIPRGKGLRRLS